jgi:hypothetical protein
MATRWQEFIARGERQYGPHFRPPEGAEFIEAFNKGEEFRVLVRAVYPLGDIYQRWGYVSATTGWEPAFMLMKRRGVHGSSDLLDPKRDKIVDYKWLKDKRR